MVPYPQKGIVIPSDPSPFVYQVHYVVEAPVAYPLPVKHVSQDVSGFEAFGADITFDHHVLDIRVSLSFKDLSFVFPEFIHASGAHSRHCDYIYTFPFIIGSHFLHGIQRSFEITCLKFSDLYPAAHRPYLRIAVQQPVFDDGKYPFFSVFRCYLAPQRSNIRVEQREYSHAVGGLAFKLQCIVILARYVKFLGLFLHMEFRNFHVFEQFPKISSYGMVRKTAVSAHPPHRHRPIGFYESPQKAFYCIFFG